MDTISKVHAIKESKTFVTLKNEVNKKKTFVRPEGRKGKTEVTLYVLTVVLEKYHRDIYQYFWWTFRWSVVTVGKFSHQKMHMTPIWLNFGSFPFWKTFWNCGPNFFCIGRACAESYFGEKELDTSWVLYCNEKCVSVLVSLQSFIACARLITNLSSCSDFRHLCELLQCFIKTGHFRDFLHFVVLNTQLHPIMCHNLPICNSFLLFVVIRISDISYLTMCN